MQTKTTGTEPAKSHTTIKKQFNSPFKNVLSLFTTGSSVLGIVATASTTMLMSSIPSTVYAEAIGPLAPQQRAIEARKLRTEAAQKNFLEPLPAHPDNGDENTYLNKINSYTKGLLHDSNGIVQHDAYQSLINALSSGDPADFNNIIMGTSGGLGLRNPQAAYTYFMEGKDPHSYTMPAAPTFDSAWQASDAIEVMWQALTRDVPFANYDIDPDIQAAVAEINTLSDYRGPSENGAVTSGTLFRGIGTGENVGPYISQFLLLPIPYGATKVEQKYNVPVADSKLNDFLTDLDDWRAIQNGAKATAVQTMDSQPRYLFSGRAMAQYVLKDFVNQAYLDAARILSQYKKDKNGLDLYGVNDPLRGSNTEARGPLFGINHVIDLLSRVSMGSQNVAWYQKWLVHRRARPEVFFGRVHVHKLDNGISYPINAEVLNSALDRDKALFKVFERNGTYLLPTATPDGSPLHPTYPAGHAVMAGAAVTMLKAFFNGDFVIPNPVQPSADGLSLEEYTGPDLTIEGELNKLGSNISLGRDVAGVHYRTDGDLGMALGEAYAISLLSELVKTYNEDFAGFTFNRFDGTPVLVSKDGVFFN